MATMTPPPVDIQAARHFLDLLGLDPAGVWFRTLTPNRGANLRRRDPNREGWAADLHGFNAAELEADCRAGGSVYLITGTGSTASGRNKDGHKTGCVTDGDITCCHALFVEWDKIPIADQLIAWKTLHLPEPTAMVLTGGKSVHTYWALSEAIDPDTWHAITARLIAYCQSDSSCSNPSRLMRLPGGIYHDKKTGQPTGQPTIIHESGLRYSLAEIEAAIAAGEQSKPDTFDFTTPPESMVGVSIPTGDQRRQDFPIRTMEEVRDALTCIPRRVAGNETYPNDRRLLWGLIRACEEAGSTRQEAISLMEAHSPSAVSGWNVDQVGGYDFSKVRSESFWKLARLAGWLPQEERGSKRSTASSRPSDHGEQAQATTIPAEPPPLTFRELLALVLEAVRAGDEDGEMEARSEIMARFRRTDGQITAALFRLLSQQEQDNGTQQQRPDYRSIDLSKVSGIDWLLEGFVPANDQALLYAPAGAGKTTAALGMAFAVTDGSGFLDRATNAPRGNVLLIASDSGTAPLIRSIQEMGRGDDPALSAGGDHTRLHVWAHDTEQAGLAWEASLRGCLRLLEFVQAEQITLVLIDSCKAVTSKADLNYCDNGQVTALLTFFKEVLCQHCAVVWINHDGTGGGEAAGAKAWKEVPSAVHSIEMVPEGMDDGSATNAGTHKGKPVRFSTRLRSWKVRKCRQGTAREFMYRIDEETGCLAVCHTVEVIKDCRAAIVDVLAIAMNNGKASLHSRAIVEELQAKFKYSQGTIRNGLTRVTGGKWPEVVRVPSLRGHYRLAPKVADALTLDPDLSL